MVDKQWAGTGQKTPKMNVKQNREADSKPLERSTIGGVGQGKKQDPRVPACWKFKGEGGELGGDTLCERKNGGVKKKKH